MSLREEMWKYEQITGESAEHVPIIKLGAFLDGYEMGIKALGRTSYKSEARRWKRRYLDLKQRIFKMEERTSWISVRERLPEDLEPVNITWVNHEPEPYYHDIKDRNFVATGIYYRGQWYWYSTTCADYLGEYGSNEIDKVDDAVEIIAWMPLPQRYEAESEVEE